MNATWSADPWGRFPYRWFDGNTWTALVFDGATQYLDPYVTQVMLHPVAPAGALPGVPGAPVPGPVPMAGTVPMPTYPVVTPQYPPQYSAATFAPGAMPPPPATGVAAPPTTAAAPTTATARGAGASSAAHAPAPPPTQRETGPTNAAPTADARTANGQSAAGRAASGRANPGQAGNGQAGNGQPGNGQAGNGQTTSTNPPSGTAGRSATRQPTRRPWWVPVVGSIAVVGLAWWLFNLRDGDDGSTSAIADQGAVETTVAEVTTTTVAATLPPATLPPTTMPEVTTPAVVGPDPALVQDCVDFVPTAAYIGDAGATDLWNASGFDVEVLRSLCAALPEWRLGAIAEQRDALDLAFTGSTSPTATTTTVAAPATTVADGVVPVSPTMPPPLPSTAP